MIIVSKLQRVFSISRPTKLARMAHQCLVKNSEDCDRLEVSLEYGHRETVSRQYNASRLKNEPLSNVLTRLGTRIESQINKSNKKRKRKDEETKIEIEIKIFIQIKNQDGTKVIDDETPVSDALVEGNMMVIDGIEIPIVVNPPTCVKIGLPESVMVGFPIFPMVHLEYVHRDKCEYRWFRVKYQEELPSNEPNVKKKKNQEGAREIKESYEVSSELIYSPVIADIDFFLQFACIPKSEERQGRTERAITKYEVKPGPGICPFDHRHLYTQKETESDEVRIVSYNILADLYADQDFSRDVLFSYCPPYALAIDYRKPLLIKEIQGYRSDLFCLQEVDTKVFQNDLITSLDMIGYEGFHLEKGDTREGSAIFYRKSKFRLLECCGETITNVLETSSICQDIVKKAYAITELKEIVQSKKSVIHVLVLEPVNRPDRVLIIANTHLYFHPDAGHIRMIQTLVAMRYIDSLLKKYSSQKPTLIFCGDFNSTPNHAIYEFMTSKSVKEDHSDWNDGGPSQFVPEMNFTHNLNIASGCGLQPYTNYSDKFNGQLDYIFYDTDSFEVSQVIPQPDHRDVELNMAIPSIVFPSDHIAQVCDLKWK